MHKTILGGLALATALLAGCGSTPVSQLAVTTPVPTDAPTLDVPTPTDIPVIDCTLKESNYLGASIIENFYSTTGIQWFNSTSNYPQTCDGIRMGVSAQNSLVTVTFATKPSTPPLCSHNGWSYWANGDRAVAEAACTKLTGNP